MKVHTKLIPSVVNGKMVFFGLRQTENSSTRHCLLVCAKKEANKGELNEARNRVSHLAGGE